MRIGLHAPKQGATETFFETANNLQADLLLWTLSEQPNDMLRFPKAMHIFRVPTPHVGEGVTDWMNRVNAVCYAWSHTAVSAGMQLVFQLGNEPEVQASPDVPVAWEIPEWKNAAPLYASIFRSAFTDHGVLCAPFSVLNTLALDNDYVSHFHGIAVHSYWWANKDEMAAPEAGGSWMFAVGRISPVYVTEANSNPTTPDQLALWADACSAHVDIEGVVFYIADCVDNDAMYNISPDDASAVRRAYDALQVTPTPPQPAPTPPEPPATFSGYSQQTNPMARNATFVPQQWLDHLNKHNPAEAGQIVSSYWGACHVTGYDTNCALAQGCVETENFTSPRWVSARNAAGIGIFADDTPDVDFGTIDRGIKAQVELLSDYFGDGNEPWGILHEFGFGGDARHFTRLEQLDGVWAADLGYSAAILGYLQDVVEDATPAPPAHHYAVVTPVDCPVLQGSDGIYSHGGASPGFYAIDYGCNTGTPVRAVADGTVGQTYWQDSNPISLRTGHSIWIDHDNGFSTFSCHLERFDVATGDRVKQGQIIGLTGDPASQPDNGYGDGPHIHWEIWDTAQHVRVKMEDLEASGIAGPWDGTPVEEDTLFTVDGHIDDGRLDALWYGSENPSATKQKAMPRIKGHGIPDRWEQEFRAKKGLGAVTSSEQQTGDGSVIQYFANGWIVWYPDGTTSVN